VAAALVLLGGLGAGGYSLAGVRAHGLVGAALAYGAFLAGAILGPILLPWLPGRAFSLKGAAVGLLLVAGLVAWGWPGPGPFGSWLHLAAWAFLIPAITSFVVLTFTGASTFTSLSGVQRELRFAVPAQISAAVLGLGLWVAGLFLPPGG
jgi:acetyl-CoA decarbonylase/synthase complex subunit gamma